MSKTDKLQLLGRATAQERIEVGMVLDVLQHLTTGKMIVRRGDPDRKLGE